MTGLSRRQFLRRLAALGCAAGAAELLAACAPGVAPAATATAPRAPAATPSALPATPASPTQPATVQPDATVQPTPQPAYLAVARGPQPAELTRRAIAAIGGIERFVKPGANVIIKPNICIVPYSGFEQGATTNPEVVATLVRLCLGAGARRVRVMDQPFQGTPDAAYAKSGIAEAVKAAGGEMEIMAAMKFRDADIPNGKDLKRWKVYGDILDADLVINVPVAKTHGIARLTLAGKNLMGVVVDRGAFHLNIGQRIADIASLVRPQLTVIDAVRIMVRSGPTGGNPNDVKLTNTVIASADMVAADAYATRLFNMKPADIAYIKAAAEMKLGTMDLSGVKVEEITL